jgi:hypothetical protein
VQQRKGKASTTAANDFAVKSFLGSLRKRMSPIGQNRYATNIEDLRSKRAVFGVTIVRVNVAFEDPGGM